MESETSHSSEMRSQIPAPDVEGSSLRRGTRQNSQRVRLLIRWYDETAFETEDQNRKYRVPTGPIFLDTLFLPRIRRFWHRNSLLSCLNETYISRISKISFSLDVYYKKCEERNKRKSRGRICVCTTAESNNKNNINNGALFSRLE